MTIKDKSRHTKSPNDESDRTLLSKGNKAFREHRYSEAMVLYHNAIRNNPNLESSVAGNIKLAKNKISISSASIEIQSQKSELTVGWVHNSRDLMTHQYRIHNYSKKLSDYGIKSVIIPENNLKNIDNSSIDVLILCRIDANADFLQMVNQFKLSGKPVIFDIDDNVFDPEQILSIRHVAARDDAYRQQLFDMSSRLKSTMLAADFVTVSTHALKKEVERFGKPAFIIPNNISAEDELLATEYVKNAKSKKTRHVRVGYFSGTATHEFDFMECSDALYDLMTDQENMQFMVVGHLASVERFKIFGNRFIQLGLMPHAKMLEQLATIHINLAPLEYKNRFTQGKSELKIFEAALFGIPSIASPTASYGALIQHGINGFLARQISDWKNNLLLLLKDNVLREKLGANAKDSIAKRFYISSTVTEYSAFLKAIKKGTLRKSFPRYYSARNEDTPAVSVISILYKKEREVWFFLESLRRQNFDLKYEVILVDDSCPGGTVNVVTEFQKSVMTLPDSNKNMSLRIINNSKNLGNCTSRNKGVSNSSGAICIIVDADCMLDSNFIASHYAAFDNGMCDVAIGPKGIETNSRHPLSVLNVYDLDKSLAIEDAVPQDPVNQDSFVNCVTRNLSISRSYINKIGDLLFDDLFTYSHAPNSGFGWEDVELGCRLYKAGARIKFLNETASLHISHPPSVDSPDKPYRSLLNFKRLHEKHPWLKFTAHAWSLRTFKAITNWCRKVSDGLENNENFQYLENEFKKINIWPVYHPNKSKRLKILTYRWHCPHQYELYRLGHEFTLASGLGTKLIEHWDWGTRPLPTNARFTPADALSFDDYDVAILHFDENVLNPEYSINPGTNKQMVPNDWGNAFKGALKWKLPKIAICHGTPQFYGQYNCDYSESNLGTVIEDRRLEIVAALKDVMVVCNSHQAQKEWGFHKSVVIWQGFSSHDFPQVCSGDGLLSMSLRALENRPHYNGLFVFKEISSSLNGQYSINSLNVPNPPHTYIPRTFEWAKVKYENYVRELSRYAIYINPTVRSPMPRTRGEAMMAGLVTVSLRNHDVAMFIDNGVDGFYADSAAEMADQIRYLMKDKDAARKMAVKSREKAIDVFNQHRYLTSWDELLKGLV